MKRKLVINMWRLCRGETSYNFKYDRCGLFVNTSFAHLGASPDGVITCVCYGTGLVEIRCEP